MTQQRLTRASTDQEIIVLWLAGKSKTTVKTYVCHVKQFIDFMNQPLAEITLDDLVLWVNRLNLTYTPPTVANKILCIKSLFSFCVKVGYLSFNIGALIKPPKTRDKRAEKILDQGDVKRLIEQATPGRDRVLLCLIYTTGLRVSEAVNLTWSDLKGNKLAVYGKGSKLRFIIVPDWLLEQLQTLPKISEFIFATSTGKPIDRIFTHRMIKKCAEKAGIDPKTSAHWLRHSHASHAINNGCNVRLLQESLGHSKLETTEKYLHINPNSGSSQFITF
ncbi:tyrosine-type recombinase/integrase [Gloeothece verrucosa]|uniref:Integrase family protein n=1 Tax=Gloeothece verrucosa (strain PCC 7822) TaxID=497965 RepID=E0UP12_GLOV7|nr:tyrosine-type recombinase/integrase [Gloeothece verrucosa]ADN18692.1 integrase family protein [Gloeothece verrucosa PCC 7822]